MAALSTDGVDCCQTVGVEAFGNTLDELLSFYRQASLSCAVGWESYLVTGARSADSTDALRVIGVAQWLAHRYSAEVLPEVPSSARTVVSNDLLKRLGWYTPGLDHANQAARHLAAWLAREHLLTPDQREAFTSSLAAGTPE
jgi:hypothetical protein